MFLTGAERSFLPQDSNNLEAQRGLSSFHAKHRFVLSYLYELPFGQGSRWLNHEGWVDALAGGWKLGGISTLQSGQPFTVHRSLPQSGSGTAPDVPADRPDQIADPFQAVPMPGHPDPACQSTVSQGGRAADEVRTPSMWFNPCAFAAAPGRFGTAPRNSVLGPNFRNLDFSVLKDIPLPGEAHKLAIPVRGVQRAQPAQLRSTRQRLRFADLRTGALFQCVYDPPAASDSVRPQIHLLRIDRELTCRKSRNFRSAISPFRSLPICIKNVKHGHRPTTGDNLRHDSVPFRHGGSLNFDFPQLQQLRRYLLFLEPQSLGFGSGPGDLLFCFELHPCQCVLRLQSLLDGGNFRLNGLLKARGELKVGDGELHDVHPQRS